MYIRQLFTVVILLACTKACYSQLSSILYDRNYQLVCDTTFKIDRDSYAVWEKVESGVLTELINAISYPQYLIEAGINGKCIYSFCCDSVNGICNIQVEKFSAWGKEYENFNKTYEKILGEAASKLTSWDCKGCSKNMKFYLPVQFKFTAFENNRDSLALPVKHIYVAPQIIMESTH